MRSKTQTRLAVVPVALLCVLALGLLCVSGFKNTAPTTASSSRISYSTLLRMAAASGRTAEFVKYQGLGNDFILVDNTMSSEPIYSPEEAIKLCNRNFGIGADGLIFAMPGKDGSDYTMRIYNSDGSEPQMCGNGIRCMAKYLQKLEKKESEAVTYTISTKAGLIVPVVAASGLVTVDMGLPITNARQVPSLLALTMGDMAVDSNIDLLGKTYKTTAVSMGNPHAITFVDDLDAIPFTSMGPACESHPMFPEKVNAEFVQVLSKTHLRMKVWERGAGPTLACGTGACAVVVAAVLTGRSERKCTVTLPGGDLVIEWDEASGKIYMAGPAEPTFAGSHSL